MSVLWKVLGGGDGGAGLPDMTGPRKEATAMRLTSILIAATALLMLAACSNGGGGSSAPSAPPTPALIASGGNGTNGTGGNGGYVYIESYGSAKVLASGTVDASFPDPAFSPNFGAIPYVVSSDTTVLLDSDPSDGSPHLYAKAGVSDPRLYLGNGDGDAANDPAVTGLTVDAGATLTLVDQGYCGTGCGYATLQLTNDLVINGTVTTDVNATEGLYIEAYAIDVESGGKITTSATVADTNARAIYLGYGNDVTRQIINHGAIEAKGNGAGSGGSLYMEPADLVVNYGTLDTSGGSSATSGGNAGWIQIYVDYGNFYSSGTVRMNGGNGGAGNGGNSNTGSWIETAYYDITYGIGDIIISGTWEANGGHGTNGNGGSGGFWGFETDAMGAVTINATMSTKGGNGTGTGSTGGSGNEIYIDSENYRGVDPATPAKIRIAGQYDLRGGDGDLNGGSGGYIEIYSYGSNASSTGTDVELVNFPAMDMNGGNGATTGGSASVYALSIYTYSAGNPTSPITNEAAIQAKGGNATATGGTGGLGGYVDLWTDNYITDTNTVITNSGSIDVSGGAGDTGGAGYYISMQAEHVSNPGSLTANGGDGTTQGGSGGYINLNSNTTPTAYTVGTLSVNGGSGATPGAPGTISIDGSPI